MAILNLGFRIFFFAAGCAALFLVVLWGFLYSGRYVIDIQTISMSQWHAHEMIYGYCLAVIAGFLLAAVKNWTGKDTLVGMPLFILFLCWFMARMIFIFFADSLLFAGLFDVGFCALLLVAICVPIFASKQWIQLGIVFNVLLFTIANTVFYLGVAGVLDNGVYWGIYGSFYLLIALVIMMGGRVVPFFIESGVGYPIKLYSNKWFDISSLVFLLILMITELFIHNSTLSSIVCLFLFVINSLRLIGWHTHGIWKNPMLWSLYLAFVFITLGFLLLAFHPIFGLSKYIAYHCFTYGGVGLLTLSMMSRVALGHTGRNVNAPDVKINIAFVLLIVGAIFRTFLIMGLPQYGFYWIMISIGLWVGAFALFLFSFSAILWQPRVDGKPG